MVSPSAAQWPGYIPTRRRQNRFSMFSRTVPPYTPSTDTFSTRMQFRPDCVYTSYSGAFPPPPYSQSTVPTYESIYPRGNPAAPKPESVEDLERLLRSFRGLDSDKHDSQANNKFIRMLRKYAERPPVFSFKKKVKKSGGAESLEVGA